MIVFSSSSPSSSSTSPLSSTSADLCTMLSSPLLSISLSYLPTPNFIPKLGTGLIISPSAIIETSANISISFPSSSNKLSSAIEPKAPPAEYRRARPACAGVVQNFSSWGLGPERGVDGAGGGFDLGLGLDEEAIGGVGLSVVALVGIGGLTRGRLFGFCCFSAVSLCRDRKR
jgi:hypothetical protein